MTTRPAHRRAAPRPRLRGWNKWAALFASAPMFQALFCIPDLLGAFSFELQNLLNNIIFTVVDTVIRNLFDL